MRAHDSWLYIWLLFGGLGCLLERGSADGPLSPGPPLGGSRCAVPSFSLGTRSNRIIPTEAESPTFHSLYKELDGDLKHRCASASEKPWANGFWKAAGTDVTRLIERNIDLNGFVRLISDSLNAGKPPTFADVYSVLRRGFIPLFIIVAVVVTLVLLFLYIFAQVRGCRSCWSFLFCRVFCYDTQRLPLKELPTWRKALATILFLLFGVGVFWFATICIARGMTFFGQGLQDMNCQTAKLVDTLAFGGVSAGQDVAKASTPVYWSGLDCLSTVLKDFRTSGIKGIVETVNKKFHNAEALHYNKVTNAINDSEKRIQIVSQAAKAASFEYISGNYYIASLYELRQRVDAFHKTVTSKNLPVVELKNNDLTQRLESAEALLSSGAVRLKDVYASWKVVAADLGRYIIPATVVVLCMLGAVAFIGWIIASLWARVWRRERIPSHGLKAGTTGSYILYGVAALISIVFALLLFVLILVPAASCGAQRDPILATIIRSPLLSDDVRPILLECMKPDGGDLSKIFIKEDVLNGGFADLGRYESWEKQLKDNLKTVNDTHKALLANKQLLNLVVHTSVPHLTLIGIQDSDITVDCSTGVISFCKGRKTKTTILGAQSVETRINKLLGDPAYGVCITNATKCKDTRHIPIGSVTPASFETQISKKPELRRWLTFAQKIAEVRWKQLSNCPSEEDSHTEDPDCSVDGLLHLSNPVEKTIISPVLEAVNEGLDGPSGAAFFVRDIRKHIPLLEGLHCAPIREAAATFFEAFCQDTGSVLGVVFLGFFLHWSGFLFLMVFMFVLWHYAHNLLFIAPKYDGVTPSQVIIEVTDPDYTRGHLIRHQ